MLIMGKDRAAIVELKRTLHEQFSMKELGETRHILGMWIERDQLRLNTDFTDSGTESVPTPTLYCDSQSAIHLMRNPIIHTKTKHIEIRYHHIQELVTEKRLKI